MRNRKRVLLVVFSLLFCLGCDQATKYLARNYLPRTKVVSLAGSPLKLHYSENKGASFAFE
ncbi:MAG: signal peptidase II [Syntrophobacter sp.]